jgi:cellulose synthase/poly-beta-1,6-N-acetylglucosamine synthase-like glycosyltransferase
VIYCLIGLLILYGLVSFWLWLGLFHRYPRTEKLPSVSLLVCVRNEETTLPDLLTALESLDYHKDLLEIILVNDQSTDNTAELISKYTQQSQFSVKVVNINLPPYDSRGEQKGGQNFSPPISGGEIKGGLLGKTNALIQGMEQVSHDIVVFTDANARPRPDWIRNLVSYFTDEVGLVGGPVRIVVKGLWSRLQALDWVYLFAAGSGTAGWGFPQSVFGKNAAIRTSVYKEIGTWKSIPFSVTEDLALLAAVRDRTTWKIRLPLEESIAVDATPTPNLRTLWHQRRRWLIGGVKVTALGQFMLVLMLLMTLAIVVSLFIHPAWTLGLFLLQCALDLPLVAGALWRIERLSWLIYLPLYRVVYILLLIPIVVSILFTRSVHWKDQIRR